MKLSVRLKAASAQLDLAERADRIISRWSDTTQLELQQRSCEFTQLWQLDPAPDTCFGVMERMPVWVRETTVNGTTDDAAQQREQPNAEAKPESDGLADLLTVDDSVPTANATESSALNDILTLSDTMSGAATTTTAPVGAFSLQQPPIQHGATSELPSPFNSEALDGLTFSSEPISSAPDANSGAQKQQQQSGNVDLLDLL